MNPAAMTLLLVSTLGFFAWTAARRFRQLSIGASDPDFRLGDGDWTRRTWQTLVYAFGQRKMPYYRAAGVAHMMIFGGFQVLLLNSIVLWVRGYDPQFDFWGLLAHDAPIGMIYGFVKDTFIVLVLLGVGVFVYYRIVTAGRSREGAGTQRMTLGWEGLVILGIIAVMMVADIAYWGAWKVITTRSAGGSLHLGTEWAASLFAFSVGGLSESTLHVVAHLGFWIHASLVLIFLNILPFSKHFHILTAIPNVFTHRLDPAGRLPPVADLEGRVEREESVGINRVEDLTWNHLLDLYTCTECGRCSDNCPAYVTDKKLSPKHLTLALRDHLYDAEQNLFGKVDGLDGGLRAGPDAESGTPVPIHTHPPSPDGYYRAGTPVELVPNVVHPDVLWACTSCRACEEQCPVMISYVDKIVGMRRELVMMKGEMPPELQRPFMGMETNGNPWNVSAMDRDGWAAGLDIPTLRDHPGAAVLYWVGCAASYDDRAKKTARSVARLLRHAGVDFAILGTEETCTGDPARRAGNEYLFQMLAEQNVETLNGYGVAKKTVVTACPHCFNTLKNEYPDFGGRFDVVHHSAFLNGLLASGKLRPTKRVNATVAFHDSCYLGRYNDVYDEPRKVLESIPGLRLVEVPYWNRNKGLCCGAGGAQMWMEEQNDNRVNVKRTLQILDTGADTIASGCPFCMTMLTDGLKNQEKDESVRQLDIAEMLVEAMDLDAAKADVAAAE